MSLKYSILSSQNGMNQYTPHNYYYSGVSTRDGRSASGRGLETYDFDARFYDPQLGRWFAPIPAEQFHNPYLAMGRTKREESLRWSDLASGQPAGEEVSFVDPDGEFIFAAVGIGILANALITGAVIGAASYTASVEFSRIFV